MARARARGTRSRARIGGHGRGSRGHRRDQTHIRYGSCASSVQTETLEAQNETLELRYRMSHLRYRMRPLKYRPGA
eukprot:2252530-Rhodomonas_salina.1